MESDGHATVEGCCCSVSLVFAELLSFNNNGESHKLREKEAA